MVENPAPLPEEVRTFLADIKPGFEDDPTRAVYNHIWLIGDSSAIGGQVQAEIDELAELTEVGTGAGGAIGETDGASGAPGFAPPSSADAEPEPIPKPGKPGQP